MEAQDYSDAILLLINMIEIDSNWEKGFSLLAACNQKADDSALAVKSFRSSEVKPAAPYARKLGMHSQSKVNARRHRVLQQSPSHQA